MRKSLLFLLGVAVVAAALLVPVPGLYAFVPGPLRDVNRSLELQGGPQFPPSGELYLTTVRVESKVTLADLIRDVFDSTRATVSQESVLQGKSPEEVTSEQARLMQLSKQAARAVALEKAGLGRATGKGARVRGFAPSSPAEGELRRGDVIIGIEGNEVTTACDVTREMQRLRPGEEAHLLVSRNGKEQVFRIETVASPENPQAAFLGVAIETVDFRLKTSVDARFRTGAIGGPSAGLMLALGLYDHLTPGELTQGKEVAGTGEIDCGGVVGAVGGIEQKVAAARRHGVDLFLVPRLELEAARQAAGELEVIPVNTFAEALRKLTSSR